MHVISKMSHLRILLVRDPDNFEILCCFNIVMNGACLSHKQRSLVIARAKVCEYEFINLSLFGYCRSFSCSGVTILNSLSLLVLAVGGFEDQQVTLFEESYELICRPCIS